MTRAAGAVLGALCAVSLAGAAGEASGQVRGLPSVAQVRPLAAKPVTFPAFETRTLANGLRIVAAAHREQPAVSIRLLVGAGSAQDAPAKSGTANLVALLLEQGTATRSARQIVDAMDAAGGAVTVTAGTDLTFAYASVLEDSFDEGLGILADIVRAPALAPDEIERQRRQLRSALRVTYGDPNFLATLVHNRIVYGAHPYGLPVTGTPVSIDGITRDDLLAFHARHYVPNNCLLAIVGDVDPVEALAAAERAFGSWERRDVPAGAVPDPPAPARRVVVVDTGESPQTEIRAGHLAVPRASGDYRALDLAARVLGGEGANRLEQVLRAKKGLTYGASAELEAYRLAGRLVAETDTWTEATVDALRVVVDEFRRLQRDAAGGRELEAAKGYLAGSFPLEIETPDAIATRILMALFYGRPTGELNDFGARVSAVTSQAVAQAARAHVKPDQLSIVLVGNARAFVPQLSRLGISKPDVIPLAELDVTAAGLRRVRQPAPAEAGVTGAPMAVPLPGVPLEEWDRAKAVVMRAIAAAGGLDALRAIRTVRAVAETSISTPDGPVRAETRTSIEYPLRVRVDVVLPRGEVVQAYDNGHAWIRDPTGPHDAPASMKDEFEQSIRRDWIALYLAAADDRVLGRRLPDEEGRGGRPLAVVELWGNGLSRVRLAVDEGSGRLAWVSRDVPGPAGRVTIVESFDDFRPVRGVEMPYVAVVRRDGVLVMERTLVEIQLNVTFPASHFEKSW